MQFLISIFGDWQIVALILLAGGAFAWSMANRIAWDKAWEESGNGNTRIPERCWVYDAHDLESFATRARGVPMGQKTALEFYAKDILKGSDIFFAIALAAVTAYVCYKIAVSPMPWPWLNWVALPLGAMGLLYGVADVAEDLKLAAILGHPEKIDRADAAATNMLTRIKIASLSLSIVGLSIFLVITFLEKLYGKSQSKEPAAT
jgi:formate-dependent nitrite reductase membrane component NrfD